MKPWVKKQERQKCSCCHIFRTSVNWQIPALSSNEFYIILLIMRWFLYIDIFILLTLKLIHHALITSLQYKFSFLKTTFSLLRNWNDETNDVRVVSFEKVFHWTIFLALESQKFLSLKCFVKPQKNSLIGI